MPLTRPHEEETIPFEERGHPKEDDIAMVGTLLMLGLLADSTGTTFDGRRGELNVTLPRVEATLVVDGHLNEAIW
jgi:hypothetical protein